jgi:hypothetical protein
VQWRRRHGDQQAEQRGSGGHHGYVVLIWPQRLAGAT